jgi:hypothetical protein
MAENGTTSFSGLSEKDRPISNSDSAHLQVPELMLHDDRHLFRIAFLQRGRNPHAGGFCQEGDEEMMVARQVTGHCDLGQHLADHATQRILGKNVVSDVVLRHQRFLSCHMARLRSQFALIRAVCCR